MAKEGGGIVSLLAAEQSKWRPPTDFIHAKLQTLSLYLSEITTHSLRLSKGIFFFHWQFFAITCSTLVDTGIPLGPQWLCLQVATKNYIKQKTQLHCNRQKIYSIWIWISQFLVLLWPIKFCAPNWNRVWPTPLKTSCVTLPLFEGELSPPNMKVSLFTDFFHYRKTATRHTL